MHTLLEPLAGQSALQGEPVLSRSFQVDCKTDHSGGIRVNADQFRTEVTRRFIAYCKDNDLVTVREFDHDRAYDYVLSYSASYVLRLIEEGDDIRKAYRRFLDDQNARWKLNDVLTKSVAEATYEMHDGGYVGSTEIRWLFREPGKVDFDAVDTESVAMLWFRFCLENGLIRARCYDREGPE